MSSISDVIAELNSSNVNYTANSTEGSANVVDNGTEEAFMFDTMLLVQFLLPMTLATLIWGRKWIFTRALLHLDKSCISILCPSISKRERLIRWTSQRLPSSCGIQGAQLRNLWLNGSHLCTLINSVVPGACANPHRHWKRAPTHAQALAYKYFGIIPIFTDADFQTKTMTPNLEQTFQNYLTELQTAISKISHEQESLKRSHSHAYITRGMGLTTGEQFRKNYFYIYPTDMNHRFEDIIITMKGPYNTYGSVVLKSMNILNSNSSAPYKSSIGKEIYQQCVNLKENEKSFLRDLPIDLTNILNTSLVKREENTLDFNIKIEKGRAKVAFISKNNGIHELCITAKGEHISGSPFNINIEKNSSGVLDSFAEVQDQHIYKTVNRKVIKKEIDFITEKVVLSNNGNLYDFPIIEESNSALVELIPIDRKKKLIRQENVDIDKEEEEFQSKSVIEKENDQINKTINSELSELEQTSEYLIDEHIESVSNVATELELLVQEEISAEEIHEINETNSKSQDLIVFQNKLLFSEENELLHCSSDLSNIELEELEDTESSEPASIESTNKLSIVQRNNYKANAMIRKHSSKLNSNHSIYCSSEFSTNSIELEELEDNDLSSDEFLYFGQNIYPQESIIAEISSTTTATTKPNISVKERIAYYNKTPREIEENIKKVITVDIAEPMECSTFEPDILTCHTVKYSEIITHPSPIWKHIVQEENPTQNITLFNTSSEIDQETNVLNTSIISSCSSINKENNSSRDSCLEEDKNSMSNIRDFRTNDLSQMGEYPQSYYNKSSEEFSEMYRKRKQFWDRKSIENSSGCSSDSSLSNPIVSSYSFYNNRRLSSEKSFDGSSNFHRSLDCFESRQYTKEQQISDDDLCKSTDDLAFASVKERKLLFIKDMNNQWSKGKTSTVKLNYLNNQKLKIPEKVIEQEAQRMDVPITSVMDKIKIFDKDTHIKSKLEQPVLQNEKQNLSKPKDFIPMISKKLRKSETILSNKENFKKAQSYFKTLESGKKTVSKVEFNINQIERRHSVDCENKIKKWEAEIIGGSFTLPRVSEKFSLDNIYKDVLGDRKKNSHFKGSPNKLGVIVTLHAMPDQARELDIESEFKEELFFGQKKFKDRPRLNSVFPIHY